MKVLQYGYRALAISFLVGVATMAVLAAGAAYVNPPARCVSENGTIWASAPVSKCYKLTDFVPAGALLPAK